MANRTIWSVGGGKGGIGKSVATANIGCALARAGKQVVLVDADLGGANLHTYFGVKYPPIGLDDFIKGRIKSLEEASVATPLPNLRLICGAGEFLGIANPAYGQKLKLIGGIKKLEAEYIIVDLGAGSSFNVLDFFGLSSEGIVVLVPEPAAIQNAYVFLKSFVYRRLQRLFAGNPSLTELIRDATDARSEGAVKSFADLCGKIAAADRAAAEAAVAEVKGFRPKLLLNMAASVEDVKVVEAFTGAARTFLGLETDFVGTLFSRPSVKAAARRMRPFMLDDGASDAHADMRAIIGSLLSFEARERALDERAQEEAPCAEAGAASAEKAGDVAASKDEAAGIDAFGFNENVGHAGAVFHVQTEALGGGAPFVETVIYQGGRIFFSKRTDWKEAGPASGMGFREFATRQHKAAVAAVKAGRITLQQG